jgi:hypothetical protein
MDAHRPCPRWVTSGPPTLWFRCLAQSCAYAGFLVRNGFARVGPAARQSRSAMAALRALRAK